MKTTAAKKKTATKGTLKRANFDSLLAWESAVSAVYGGIARDWPQWAKDVLLRERGYVG